MANFNFKFDQKKFEKNLTREVDRIIKQKKKELIIKNNIVRRKKMYECITKKRRGYVISNVI